MFESVQRDAGSDLDGLMSALLHVEDGWRPNGKRVDQLDAIERAKAALAAVQARVTDAFVVEEEQVAAVRCRTDGAGDRRRLYGEGRLILSVSRTLRSTK